MDYSYNDLIWELGQYKPDEFKVLIKILFLVDKVYTAEHIIYGEFKIININESIDFKSEELIYANSDLEYHSLLVNLSEFIEFVKLISTYRDIKLMKIKEKKDENTIRNSKICSKLSDGEFSDLFSYDNYTAYIGKIGIRLKNLNYNSICNYFDSNPIEYSQSKDSSTIYYQIDFSANSINLNNYREIIDVDLDYYPDIYDLIYDKFSKDLRHNAARLKHSALVILPKEHIGKIKVTLIENIIKIKVIRINREHLLLKIQIKKQNPPEIKHYNVFIDPINLENKIELDFIPDEIEGWLFDVDDENKPKIQKIVKKLANFESDISVDNIRKIILNGEGLNTDFKEKYPHAKSDSSKLHDNKMIREICSFANAEGGLTIFGVNDEAVIKGYNIKEQFKSQGYFEQYIQRLCNDELEPPVIAQVIPIEIDNHQLQIVKISGNNDYWVKIKKSGKIIIRKGSTKRDATAFDLKKCPKNLSY